MTKKSKLHSQDDLFSMFIQILQQYPDLIPYLQYIQKSALSIEKKLTIPDHIRDLNANFELIQTRLFLNLQIQRLIVDPLIKQNIDQSFNQLQHILKDDIIVSAASRQLLDPHCKSEQQYSSAIFYYKKWLFYLIFLMVFFHPVKQLQDHITIFKDLLLLAHHIEQAETVSKVTLRLLPQMDAAIVLELPRGTSLYIHHHFSSQHWAEVTIPEFSVRGHLPFAYIKTDPRKKLTLFTI